MTRRLDAALSAIIEDPTNRRFAVPLQGLPNNYRWRVGNLRIVYTVDRRSRTVTIKRIEPRGQVYRNL